MYMPVEQSAVDLHFHCRKEYRVYVFVAIITSYDKENSEYLQLTLVISFKLSVFVIYIYFTFQFQLCVNLLADCLYLINFSIVH